MYNENIQPTESPLTIPHYAIPDITVPTETGDKLMPSQGRGFPGFLPACMQGTWGWLPSQVCSFPTAWKPLICTHAYDLFIVIKIMYAPSQKGAVTISKHHTKYYARVQKCLPSSVCMWGCTFEGCLISKNPILRNIQTTHISKTVQTVASNIF